MNLQILKERVQEKCKSTGISQKHLCDKLNKDRAFLSNVFRGNCLIDDTQINTIADILGTTPSYLLGETDDPSRGGVGENEVNEDETEMLELYRSLSTDNKELLKKLIEQMSGQ